MIIGFRMTDSIRESGGVEPATLEAAVYLILSFQLKQRLLVDKLLHLPPLKPGRKMIQLSYVKWILQNTCGESDLWENMGKIGRSFRAVVKTFEVLFDIQFRADIDMYTSIIAHQTISPIQCGKITIQFSESTLFKFSEYYCLLDTFLQWSLYPNSPDVKRTLTVGCLFQSYSWQNTTVMIAP